MNKANASYEMPAPLTPEPPVEIGFQCVQRFSNLERDAAWKVTQLREAADRLESLLKDYAGTNLLAPGSRESADRLELEMLRALYDITNDF